MVNSRNHIDRRRERAADRQETASRRQMLDRIAELEAAIRQSQDAIAQCLRAGGTITDGEETPWWNAVIAAQKNMAVVIRNDN